MRKESDGSSEHDRIMSNAKKRTGNNHLGAMLGAALAMAPLAQTMASIPGIAVGPDAAAVIDGSIERDFDDAFGDDVRSAPVNSTVTLLVESGRVKIMRDIAGGTGDIELTDDLTVDGWENGLPTGGCNAGPNRAILFEDESSPVDNVAYVKVEGDTITALAVGSIEEPIECVGGQDGEGRNFGIISGIAYGDYDTGAAIRGVAFVERTDEDIELVKKEAELAGKEAKQEDLEKMKVTYADWASYFKGESPSTAVYPYGIAVLDGENPEFAMNTDLSNLYVANIIIASNGDMDFVAFNSGNPIMNISLGEMAMDKGGYIYIGRSSYAYQISYKSETPTSRKTARNLFTLGNLVVNAEDGFVYAVENDGGYVGRISPNDFEGKTFTVVEGLNNYYTDIAAVPQDDSTSEPSPSPTPAPDPTNPPDPTQTPEDPTTNPDTTENPTEEPIADSDGDGIDDSEDNCPEDANAEQGDIDEDGIGDLCDNDKDGDGIDNATDECPTVAAGDEGGEEKKGCPGEDEEEYPDDVEDYVASTDGQENDPAVEEGPFDVEVLADGTVVIHGIDSESAEDEALITYDPDKYVEITVETEDGPIELVTGGGGEIAGTVDGDGGLYKQSAQETTGSSKSITISDQVVYMNGVLMGGSATINDVKIIEQDDTVSTPTPEEVVDNDSHINSNSSGIFGCSVSGDMQGSQENMPWVVIGLATSALINRRKRIGANPNTGNKPTV